MLNDPLAAALTKVLNAERVGKREVDIAPASHMLTKILTIMNDQGYIGSFEKVETQQGMSVRVNLLGNINRCGVIKPRFSAKKTGFEKWEKRYLPAKDFGVIFVSTPEGVMTHMAAKDKGCGGKLLAYCY